jgi:hypothetical protein
MQRLNRKEVKKRRNINKKEDKQKWIDGKITYRGQGMLGVKVISGQFHNFMILGESSKSLTRLSRSFFSIRSSDTRKESPKLENVHILERRCCRG